MKCYRFFCAFVFFLLSGVPGAVHGSAQNDSSSAALQVYDLRCQSRESPVGIGKAHPAFSWKIAATGRGVMQTAYQVTVASSLQKLSAAPDLWNSGKVTSGKNTFIRYDGKPLTSAKKYYWQVKVWVDNGTQRSCVAHAGFSTGLLNKNDWLEARWIGYERLADSMKVYPGVPGKADELGDKAKKRDVMPCFRKTFSVKKTVQQAYVFVCGLGQYVLLMNGKRIDSSFLNPAWSDYTKRCYYNGYDVTSAVKQGAKVIGAIVGNGFLYITRERYHKLAIAAGYPMLRAVLVIRYSDGSIRKITTDASWKTAPSAITYSSVYGGEDFDARKIQPGWSAPGFDDKGWKTPVTEPGPGGAMKAQQSLPVRVNQVFKPVRIDSSRKNIREYDFGQNTSGIIRLSASGPRGYRIRIIPSELVNADNTPDQQATGHPYYWEYTLKGKGMETWQPLFSYYGFRYAGIEVFDPTGKQVNTDAVHIDSLTSLHTQNGAPRVGSFSCSDTLFNQIFRLIRWGIRNNMSNVATDCPHREKLGWLEETHLMGNSIQYNYDILSFYTKIAADMRDAQLPGGLVPDIAPEYVVFQDGFRDSPEWGSAGVLIPWYVYQWYGDREILQKNYAMMKRYVAYLDRKSDHHLLAYGLGDWYDLGPKGPGVSQLTPLGVTATAFYYYDSKVLSRIATVLHDIPAARHYAALADTIRKAFNAKYFNPVTKVYATGSQTAYAIPLYFGLAPAKDRKAILANLADSIKGNNYALTAGDIGFRYLVQSLEAGGYNQLIYRMNNRDDVPGYGYQLRKGATALTESWQALRSVSNDHMMLGHLMEWLYSGLGGIRQQKGSVGYKRILIAPQLVSGIDQVAVTYHSINGPIAVRWERTTEGKARLHVEIPANTTAKVWLPAKDRHLVKENGKTLSEGDGIREIASKNGHVVIGTGSGSYDFSFQLEEPQREIK
jgi:hypothetical protein